jgi:hypothetical protein
MFMKFLCSSIMLLLMINWLKNIYMKSDNHCMMFNLHKREYKALRFSFMNGNED